MSDFEFHEISPTLHTRYVQGMSAVMLRVCVYCTIIILAMLAMVRFGLGMPKTLALCAVLGVLWKLLSPLVLG